MPVPKLCHRRDRNLAYITFRGKRIYLGTYGSLESSQRYAGSLKIIEKNEKIDPDTLQKLVMNLRLTPLDADRDEQLLERLHKIETPRQKKRSRESKDNELSFITGGTPIPTSTAAQSFVAEGVGNLFDAFIAEYEGRKRKNKADLQRRELVRDLIIKICPEATTDTFGPADMKRIRDYLLKQTVKRNGNEEPLTANYISKLLGTVKTAFKWGVGEGFCEGGDYYRISLFKNVDAERTTARESSRHRTITEKEFQAVQKRVLPIYRDILTLLWNTGMRPSECCSMRWDEIKWNEQKRCWFYQPRVHKTSGRGKKRIIPLTDSEKELIDQYQNDGDYVFTPAQARIQQSEIRRANRKTKLFPSHLKRNEQRQTGKQLAVCGKHINPREFGKIIKRAVKAAKMAGELGKEWTPYDLRHTAITRFIIKLGHKPAQYLAGHSHSHTTDIYDHGAEEVLFDVVDER